MRFTPRHRQAETDFRRLLEEGGVAQPDAVEVVPEGLVFAWHEPKLAVVLELEPGAEDEHPTGADRDET